MDDILGLLAAVALLYKLKVAPVVVLATVRFRLDPNAPVGAAPIPTSASNVAVLVTSSVPAISMLLANLAPSTASSAILAVVTAAEAILAVVTELSAGVFSVVAVPT